MPMPTLRRWLLLGSLLCLAGSAARAAEPPLTIRHALWDANQRPLYQACARDFEARHPGIRIRISQIGWDDYWTSLATGFVSGTAPDVFTNHQLYFSEYVRNGVMADLAAGARRDGVHDEDYEPGLLKMWAHAGRQYALPTDWDTVALAVNLDQLQAASIDSATLRRLDWNPADGGSFARLIARLTVDENGRRGDEPGFDPRRVKLHGFQITGSGGMLGQTQWSSFAASTGWQYQSAPWDGALRFDDPRFMQTLAWFAGLPARGWSASADRMGRMGADAFFLAGRVAMTVEGSWLIGHFKRHAKFRQAWFPLPVGPSGQRASMINSLGLSVWSGSRQQEAAWHWVRHAGSRECQAKIAEQGVVFPAIRGLAEVAVQAQARAGSDTRAFIEATRGRTFWPPVVPRSAEVNDLMKGTLERVLSGRAAAAQLLPEATRRAREITATP